MICFKNFIQTLIILMLATAVGCDILPVRRFRPTLNNPFPQFGEVAVVPFINASGNAKVDGREVAELYANQLQRVPGFNVIPVSTVEQAMLDLKVKSFSTVDDVRKLGEYLNADVIVIGSVNDFTGYQPPRLTLEVEWFATNPYYHPIPAGYGLPWGTPNERDIPDSIVREAERAVAKEQLKTQTPSMPDFNDISWEEETSNAPRFSGSGKNIEQVIYLDKKQEQNTVDPELELQRNQYKLAQQRAVARQAHRAAGHFSLPILPELQPVEQYANANAAVHRNERQNSENSTQNALEASQNQNIDAETTAQAGVPTLNVVPGVIPPALSGLPIMPGMPVAPGFIAGEPETFPGLPPDWPDARGLIPNGPEMGPPEDPIWSDEPVMRHVQTYNGNDADFTRRLQDYEMLFVDERQMGGWREILRNRSEFISVCCRMHIWEMLSMRGGAAKSEKICIQKKDWYSQ